MTSIEQNVKAGAKWLDREAPEWYRHLDMAKFNIDHGTKCVLGQLAEKGIVSTSSGIGQNDYWSAVRAYSLNTESAKMLGFFGRRECNAELREAWSAEISRRVNGQPETEDALPTLTVNPTEKELLLNLLKQHEADVTGQRELLKPQYRTFLNPALMTARALRLAVEKL